MSEFTEVMRNWRRMCDTYTTEDAARCCQGCPMDGQGCGAIYENDNADPEVIVREVQRWVAEHPEPVYPTWREWLQEQGVLDVEYIPGVSSTTSTSTKYVQTVKTLAPFYRPISADIAQKLGIEPKEVDRGA